MAPKRRSITAAESLKQLNENPEWVRQLRKREAAAKAREAQLQAEEAPIIADLAQAGYTVDSVWEFVNTGVTYSTAIPVLCKHLKLAYHPKIREGIARALTVKEARGIAGQDLVDQLKMRADESPNEARWALANALTVVADSSLADEIDLLLKGHRCEDVRERLQVALKRALRNKNDRSWKRRQ